MSTATNARPIQVQEGEELLNKLGIAVCDHRIFSGKHPRFLESCDAFLNALKRFYELHPEQRHVLFVHRQGQVFFRKVPLPTLTPPAIKLAHLLEDKNVEGLRFAADCNLTGLGSAIEGLCSAQNSDDDSAWQEVNQRLDAEGARDSVGFFADRELSGLEALDELGTIEPPRGTESASLLRLPQLALPLELYKSTLTALHDLMLLLSSGSNPGFDPLIEVTNRITAGMLEGDQSFLPLTTVRYSEQFTFNHSVNVCVLATAALKPFVNNPDTLVQIGQAALLHDLGKSLVPENILYSPEVPPADAVAELERHPGLGAEVLLDSRGVHPLSAVVAFDHHRRPGGKGYPAVRRHREVDTVTSVVAAADLFEALTAERPYKRSLSPAEAFEILLQLPEARGLETATRLLFDTLTPYPPGTFVELDSGEHAIVTQVRRGLPDRPCVRLVANSPQRATIADEETDLALESSAARPARRVRRALPARWDLGANAESPATEETEHERREIRRRVEDGTLLATEG